MTKQKILEIIEEQDQLCRDCWFNYYADQHPTGDKTHALNKLCGWDNQIVMIEPEDDRWPTNAPQKAILALTIEGSDLEFYLSTDKENEIKKRIKQYFAYPSA